MGAETDTNTVQRAPELVVFMGREGAGKTDQTQLYAQTAGIPHIGTGQMIRDMAATQGDGPLFDACVRVVTNNTYLEPEFMSSLLAQTLSREEFRGGAVVDGALRTLQETIDFDQTVENAGRQNLKTKVVLLRVPLWLGVARSLLRGSRRDTLEAILNRLREFSKDLGERMSIIESRYDLHRVDGRGSMEDMILEENDEELREKLIAESKREVHERILEELNL